MDSKMLSHFLMSRSRVPSLDSATQTIYTSSVSSILKDLIKSNLLSYQEIHESPERLFSAHRVVASVVASSFSSIGIPFWEQFTVQYNLFAGIIWALGTEHHRRELERMQEQGVLGCFFSPTDSLEDFIHSRSHSTAEWDSVNNLFVIDSNHYTAKTQLASSKTVVLATLIVNNKKYGIQAFLVDIKDDKGSLLPGIISVWNNDDNRCDRRIFCFKGFRAPKSALLNKYTDITMDTNNIVCVRSDRSEESSRVICHRLLSDRLCVAQAALVFRDHKFKTYKSTDHQQSPSHLIQHLFKDNQSNLHMCNILTERCESELIKYDRENLIELTDLISIAKIKCVEDSIHYVHQLTIRGCYQFSALDFLKWCKEEGAGNNNWTLMRNIARTQLDKYSRNIMSKNTRINDVCFDILERPSYHDQVHTDRQLYELANLLMDQSVKSCSILHQSKL